MADNEQAIVKELKSLMDALVGGGMKVKTAAEVGKRCVDYTRGDEIMGWMLNNKPLVQNLCPKTLQGKAIKEEQDVAELCNILIDQGFLYRAQYLPLEGVLEKAASGAIKRPTWPKRLIKTTKQRFDQTGFYIITYEGNQRWNYFLLGAILLGILAACMFQAWPLFLKLGCWYASVTLITFLLSTVILRLMLFVIMWFGGYDFWLFPNLFDEDLGVVDSFKPVCSCVNRKDKWTMLCCRLACAALVAASVYQLSKTHDLKDVGNFAKQSFLDVVDWGRQKLIAPPEEPSIYKTIGVDISTEFTAEKSGDDDADDDDYKCLLNCGYTSLHQLMNQCMSNCDCMQKLLGDECLSSCPAETINVLTEARDDICRRAGVFPRDKKP